MEAGATNRPQHGGHELVRFLCSHEPTNLEHANGQTRNDGGMLGQGFFQQLTVTLIVLEGPDFGHATEALKGTQIQLVDMGKVRVGNDDVGQRLDVTEAMGKPVECQQSGRKSRAEGIDLFGSSSRQ